MTTHHEPVGVLPAAPLPTKALVLAAGVAASLSSSYGKVATALRERLDADAHLDEGDSLTIRDPRDRHRKLGVVYRTDPKPQASVYDETEFLAHVTETLGNDGVAEVVDIPDEKLDDVLAHLLDARPDLVQLRPEVRESTRKALLAKAEGGAVIPGVQVATKPGVVTVKPGEDTAAVFRELAQGGLVDLEAVAGLPPAAITAET